MISSIGRIENRVFVPRDPVAYLRRYLDPKLDGRTMVETLKRFSPPASPDTYAYYWAVVVRCIGEEYEGIGPTGQPLYDKDEIHELLKRKHFGKVVRDKQGREETVGKSIAGIPQDEFSAYIMRIRSWAHNFLNVYIPEPESDLARAMAAEWVR